MCSYVCGGMSELDLLSMSVNIKINQIYKYFMKPSKINNLFYTYLLIQLLLYSLNRLHTSYSCPACKPCACYLRARFISLTNQSSNYRELDFCRGNERQTHVVCKDENLGVLKHV